MNKYDFGEELVVGSTLEWAYNIISSGSEILELGSAVGTLTKNLKEKKNCIIDIVEIDKISGKKAAKYARISSLGNIEGNLEREEWKELIKNKRYDYVVILDVLEHIKNSKEVLSYVGTLLKEDGEILLSVPNIAHNSVLINLFNNKFVYTELGLIDNTHIHFYTQETLEKEIEDSNLSVVTREYKQLLVGENEIDNNYSEVPWEVEAALRQRKLADVYQFLYRVIKGRGKNEEIKSPCNLFYTMYPLNIYNGDMQLIKQISINPQEVNERICIGNYEGIVRLDPFNKKCILQNLEIYEDDKKVKIVKTNAISLDASRMIFFDNDPQIFIEKKRKDSQIYISYKAIQISDEIAETFKDILYNKKRENFRILNKVKR